MRAARLHAIGGIPRVDEIEEPGADDLVVDVTTSTLNPVDIAIGNGTFYGGTPERPYVVGSEAVGRTRGGRRVWVYQRGTMAERVAVEDEQRAIEIPEGVDDGTAIACGIAGLTGWLAVSWRARVTPDDTVLVLGASGTLGATAVQGAKALGARRVIGAARRIDAVPDAADEVVELDGPLELPSATVVIDALWGEPAELALAAAAPGVRFIQVGASAAAVATIPSALVRGKVANLLGHSLGSVPLDEVAEGYRELCEHARDGRISFELETYELERIGEAWERQASGDRRAKIVIDLTR